MSLNHCIGFLLLGLPVFKSYSSNTNFPPSSQTFVCSGAEACGLMYYNNLQSEAASLATLSPLSNTMSNQAQSLYNSVVSLSNSIQSLNTLIDPPPSSSATGGIVNSANGSPQLVGLTPFMTTMSNQIIADAAQRYSDLVSLVTTVQNGLQYFTTALNTASAQANAQLASLASNIQAEITSQSQQTMNYIQAYEPRLNEAALNFNSTQAASVSPLLANLQTTEDLEQRAFSSSYNQLLAIQSKMNALTNTLNAYVNNNIQTATAYESSMESQATTDEAQLATSFQSLVSTVTTSLTNQVQNILTTDPTSAAYSNSLFGFSDQQNQAILEAMQSANYSENAALASIAAQLGSLQASLQNSFQPLLTTVTSQIQALDVADTNFHEAVNVTVADFNATFNKAVGSFNQFVNDMTTSWNITGAILSGQTTTVTQNMLNTLSNVTNDAGAEVQNLNAAMMAASQDALDADSLRQKFLQGNTQQVYSALGNNQNALDAALANIENFLSQTGNTQNSILSILQNAAASRANQINGSVSDSVSQINSMMTGVQGSANSYANALTNGMGSIITTDQQSMMLVIQGLQASGNLSANQTQELIQAMQSDNAEQFATVLQQVGTVQGLLANATAVTSYLGNLVSQTNTQSSNAQSIIMGTLGAMVNSAMTNISSSSAGLDSRLSGMQSIIQGMSSRLNANETVMTQNFLLSLNGASSNYTDAMNAAQASLTPILMAMQTSAALTQSDLTDLQNALSGAQQAVDASSRNADATVTLTMGAQIDDMSRNVSATIESAKNDLAQLIQTNLNTAISTVGQNLVNMQTNVSQLELDASTLQGQMDAVNKQPQVFQQNATDLLSSLSDELDGLQTAITNAQNADQASANTFSANLASSITGSLANQVSGTTARTLKSEGAANSSVAAAVGQVQSIVAAGVNDLEARSALFQLNVESTSASANDYIRGLFQSDYDLLNKMLNSFLANALALNDTIIGQANSSASFQTRLAALQNSVDAAVDPNAFNDGYSSALSQINAFGSSVFNQLNTVTNNTNSAVAQAHNASATGQQSTAYAGSAAANGIAISSSKVGDSVDDAMAFGTDVSGSSTNRTANILNKLGQISGSAANAVNLSAKDIAMLIAKFSEGQSIMAATTSAQNAALANTTATVQEAMVIWDAMRQSAQQLTSSQLAALQAMHDSVFNYTQLEISRAGDNASTIVDSVNQNITTAMNVISDVEAANSTLLATMMSTLDGYASSASQAASDYDSTMAQLNQSIASYASKLSNRYSAIMGMASTFSQYLEAAASNDLNALTQ